MVQKWVINLIKGANKSFFIVEKIKKYLKCPALQLRAPLIKKTKADHPAHQGAEQLRVAVGHGNPDFEK